MARKPYDENQSIHSMTTRQLRQYIADKATEAQERLDTARGVEVSKAFRDAAGEITGNTSKVKRSTSYMSKEQMREFAYALRQFNSLDVESGFAKSIEWKENKGRYETFIRNRIAEGDEYWAQYLTKKGNVSKRGYQDYKDYINFIKNIQEVKNQYGYRTLKQYAEAAMNEKGGKEKMQQISKLLTKVFAESKGKGLTQAELIERFELRLSELETEEKRATTKNRKTAKLPKPKAVKRKKSKSNVKVKTTGKMKDSAKVRERIT